MRRLLLVAACVGALAGAGVGPALAEPPVHVPDVNDCHEMNAFLHIQNVRSCDGWPSS